MRRLLLLIIFSASLWGMNGAAQEAPASLSLTVEEAMQYAIENNRNVTSARYDLLAAEKGVWEAYAAGLPTVDGSVSLGDNLAVMTRIIEMNGQQMAFKFGTQYDLAYGVSASTVIFNAPWIVGIQTAKLATTLASQGLKLTEIDTKESVMTSYYLILVTEETIKIIDANIADLEETMVSTKAMYSVGMAEATDVDQIQANLSTLNNTKASMQRNQELTTNMLRFMLGVERTTGIILTETLDQVTARVNVEALLAEDFDINENINYQLIESQYQMSELALKGAKAAVLPSLGASIYYNQNGMGDQLNDMDFYPNSVLGFQLQVPILASGLRSTRIKRAKIDLDKAENTRALVSDQLLLQEKQLRYNLISSNEQYRSQKENAEVAARILQSFENKYNQGMASSLELTQANSNYLTAQNNYLTALLNLLQTKVAYDKLMNKL
ncbi:MAG: TolC family protein [Bacteroidales bacterium]|nr:TolC family protein [Bacteroidales bacterium]MCU0410630.1 TolC family protein [Bacteroidales bacterium]